MKLKNSNYIQIDRIYITKENNKPAEITSSYGKTKSEKEKKSRKLNRKILRKISLIYLLMI